MVLKGNVKVVKQVFTNKLEPTSFQLHETFYFDRNGNIEKLVYNTKIDNNEFDESPDLVTTFKQVSEKERVGITMEKNSNDTIDIKNIELLDSYTIKVDVQQLQNSEYRKEIFQKLDTLQRLKEMQVTIFGVPSNETTLKYMYEYVYEGDLVKEIISKNNGVESIFTMKDQKFDEHGNFTYRNHIDNAGKIMFTEERTYEYYED
jgi:uncharacterized protein (DUF2249 family)